MGTGQFQMNFYGGHIRCWVLRSWVYQTAPKIDKRKPSTVDRAKSVDCGGSNDTSCCSDELQPPRRNYFEGSQIRLPKLRTFRKTASDNPAALCQVTKNHFRSADQIRSTGANTERWPSIALRSPWVVTHVTYNRTNSRSMR